MSPAPPRVLVSSNDPDQLVELVSLACSLAGEDRRAEVHALYVVLTPRSLPLDADMKEEVALGETLLARAEQVAEERFGRRIHTDLLQARAMGPAILEEISEKAIDVVVLGSRRHRGFTDAALGAGVDYVIRHAACRVVIDVPPGRAEGPGGVA